jgi:hypothetical protein
VIFAWRQENGITRDDSCADTVFAGDFPFASSTANIWGTVAVLGPIRQPGAMRKPARTLAQPRLRQLESAAGDAGTRSLWDEVGLVDADLS